MLIFKISLILSDDSEFANDLKPAVSPDAETLASNKSDRLKDHQLLKMFTQLALYSGILYLVYTISYESRDMRSYYLKSNVEKRFQFTEEVSEPLGNVLHMSRSTRKPHIMAYA